MSWFSLRGRAADPAANIRSLIGLWMYYQLRGDRGRAAKLPSERADQDGWAVMDSLFRLAVKHRFKVGYEEDDLDTFSIDVCQNWSWADPVPSPVELKALIKEGLVGAPDTSQRDNVVMAYSYLDVVKKIFAELDYGPGNDLVIAQLVSSAEDVAIGWGFKPTVRKRKGWMAKLWQRVSGGSGEH